MTLEDKIVLLTGIGKQIAKQALAAGAKMAVTGRGLDDAQSTAKELDGASTRSPWYVTGEQQTEDGVDSLVDRFGQIDVLVSNTGRQATTRSAS